MRLLTHDVLIVSRRILRDVVAADALARQGHDAQSRQVLARLASEAQAELPVIDGVISAQTDAAQALKLSQTAAIGLGVQPHEHPHAANDEQPTTPEQPSPSVA